MTPVEFKQANIQFAENQEEYLTLPAYMDENEVISCWSLTWREALKLLFTRKLWLRQLTFSKPLQPQVPQVDHPWPN